MSRNGPDGGWGQLWDTRYYVSQALPGGLQGVARVERGEHPRHVSPARPTTAASPSAGATTDPSTRRPCCSSARPSTSRCSRSTSDDRPRLATSRSPRRSSPSRREPEDSGARRSFANERVYTGADSPWTRAMATRSGLRSPRGPAAIDFRGASAGAPRGRARPRSLHHRRDDRRGGSRQPGRADRRHRRERHLPQREARGHRGAPRSRGRRAPPVVRVAAPEPEARGAAYGSAGGLVGARRRRPWRTRSSSCRRRRGRLPDGGLRREPRRHRSALEGPRGVPRRHRRSDPPDVGRRAGALRPGR